MPLWGPGRITHSPSPWLSELALHERHQTAADLLGLLLAGRLDHDPDERLGPARADQDPSAPLELPLGLADGGVNRLGPGDRPAIADADVDQLLGQFAHRVAL